MDMTREAMEFITEQAVDAEQTQVIEICGHTYATKALRRYDVDGKATAIEASTLTALVDYIKTQGQELPETCIVHVVSPTSVMLVSSLNADRERECLFVSSAQTSAFAFDRSYEQERFVIELQANFVENSDLKTLLKVAGNVEAKTTSSYGDDGTSQKVTISQGIASKVDAIVPNPVVLIPYRTFTEVEQPESKFVFRISGDSVPTFKLIEASGGIWKNFAIENIKQYLKAELSGVKGITIIG